MTIVKGNILNVHADAIVLPANTSLHEGSGVSTAIFQAASRQQLTDACKKIGHCDEGQAVATPAFNCDADYIIHAVVPKWGGGKEYERLCEAYLSALKLADVLGCESIVFPLLGSGNNGYDQELAFDIAVEAIKQSELNVTLVIYGDRIADIVKAKGYEFITVSDEWLARPIPHRNKNVIEQALAAIGDFFSKKENLEKIVVVADSIVKALTTITEVYNDSKER